MLGDVQGRVLSIAEVNRREVVGGQRRVHVDADRRGLLVVDRDERRGRTGAIASADGGSFVLDVNRAVLARVSRPFPFEPIRTLDAVHLATAELLGEAPQLVAIVTRDARVRENAKALGYVVG